MTREYGLRVQTHLWSQETSRSCWTPISHGATIRSWSSRRLRRRRWKDSRALSWKLNRNLCVFRVNLLTFEAMKAMKVGVIYGKKGQSSEIEMLGNCTQRFCSIHCLQPPAKNSEDFQDFLLFLGKIIPLKNWQKFDGGLDTSSDRTGKHSVYTTHEHVEIMFHVSTMLTDSEDDEHQHVAKKKFIGLSENFRKFWQAGNDVVVIVFIEDDKPFSPSSKFNHVYIIVKPHVTPDKKRKFYRITVATRSETGDVHPILPPGLVYEQTSLLRRLLLTLSMFVRARYWFFVVVNAENKVFQTGKFAEIKEDFRRKYLSSIYKDYSGNIKKSGDSGLSCFSWRSCYLVNLFLYSQ